MPGRPELQGQQGPQLREPRGTLRRWTGGRDRADRMGRSLSRQLSVAPLGPGAVRDITALSKSGTGKERGAAGSAELPQNESGHLAPQP